MDLPTYDESKEAAENGEATLLQTFIHNWTPGGGEINEQEFRKELLAVLEEARGGH